MHVQVQPATLCDTTGMQLCTHLPAAAADGPTYATPTSYEDALKAACTAVALVDALVASGSSSSTEGGGPAAASAFSICRPPGHHATAGEQMGFCLLNNAALAARHAQRAHGLKKVNRFGAVG